MQQQLSYSNESCRDTLFRLVFRFQCVRAVSRMLGKLLQRRMNVHHRYLVSTWSYSLTRWLELTDGWFSVKSKYTGVSASEKGSTTNQLGCGGNFQGRFFFGDPPCGFSFKVGGGPSQSFFFSEDSLNLFFDFHWGPQMINGRSLTSRYIFL